MQMKTASFHDGIQRELAGSPEFMREVFARSFENMIDGEIEVGLVMLHDIVKAQMGFPELARRTGMNEKSLHRALSRRGNPTMRTLARVRRALQEA